MNFFKQGKKQIKDERIGKEFDILLECYGPEEFNANNMMYAGLPSEGRFSIAYILHDWSEAGVNIFYSMKTTRIRNRFDEGNEIRTHLYEVILAGPEKIRLRYLGRMDEE